MGFMISMFLLSVICLLYVVKRINWLLIEKEEELRYRALKVGEEVLLSEGKNDDENLKELIDRRLDMMNQKIKSAIPGKKGTIETTHSYDKRNQLH